MEEVPDERIRATKERAISFRVTDAEYERIEEAASKNGETPNGWSRKLVLSESQDGLGVTAVDRMMLEELGVLRKMLGELRGIVEQHDPEDGKKLLEKRSARGTERAPKGEPDPASDPVQLSLPCLRS
jgi:hypothetical protein